MSNQYKILFTGDPQNVGTLNTIVDGEIVQIPWDQGDTIRSAFDKYNSLVDEVSGVASNFLGTTADLVALEGSGPQVVILSDGSIWVTDGSTGNTSSDVDGVICILANDSRIWCISQRDSIDIQIEEFLSDVQTTVEEIRNTVETRTQEIDNAVVALDNSIDNINDRLSSTEAGFSAFGTRFTEIEEEQESQITRLQAVESKSDQRETRVANLEFADDEIARRVSLVETNTGEALSSVAEIRTTYAEKAEVTEAVRVAKEDVEATVAANKTASIEADEALAVSIELARAEISGSKNLAFNSSFYGPDENTSFSIQDLPGWITSDGLDSGQASENLIIRRNPYQYALRSGNTLQIRSGVSGANTTGGTFSLLMSERIPVLPGEIYIGSCYAGAHDCDANMALLFFDENGDGIAAQNITGEVISANEALGGEELSDFKRIWRRGTAPANATSVNFYIRRTETEGAASESSLFATRPMLEKVSEQQTMPGRYTENESSGLLAEVLVSSSTIANENGTSAERLLALKSETQGLSAQIIQQNLTNIALEQGVSSARQTSILAAGIAGEYLNENPFFLDKGDDGDTVPEGWIKWTNNNAEIKQIQFNGKNSVELTAPAGSDSAGLRYSGNIPPGTYEFDVEFQLTEGDLDGAGIYVDVSSSQNTTERRVSFDFSNQADTDGIVHETWVVGRIYRYKAFKTFTHTGSPTYNMYCMLQYTTFGATASEPQKQIIITRFGVKPTTVDQASLSSLREVIRNPRGDTVRYGEVAQTPSGVTGIQLEIDDPNDSTARIAARLFADNLVDANGAAMFELLPWATRQNVPQVILSPNGQKMLVTGPGIGANNNIILWAGQTRTSLDTLLTTNGQTVIDTDGRIYAGGTALGANAREDSKSGTTRVDLILENANGTDADITGSARRRSSITGPLQDDDTPPPSWYDEPSQTTTIEARLLIDNVQVGSLKQSSGDTDKGFIQVTEPIFDPETNSNVPGKRRYYRTEDSGEVSFVELNFDTTNQQDYTFSVQITTELGDGQNETEVQYFERGA